MNEAKIKKVFSDEQFVKELLELETPEEVHVVGSYQTLVRCETRTRW